MNGCWLSCCLSIQEEEEEDEGSNTLFADEQWQLSSSTLTIVVVVVVIPSLLHLSVGLSVSADSFKAFVSSAAERCSQFHHQSW